MARIAHRFHPPLGARSVFAPDVPEAEALLKAFFGVECVLTSSGRAALNLIFADFRLSRYRDIISCPRLISRCVIDVIARHGFPKDSAQKAPAEALLRYHQYGLPQEPTQARGTGPIVEDSCHAFFWTGNMSGAAWLGDAAIISLPKFFSLSSMVGAALVKSVEMAARLRVLRDACAPFSDGEQQAQSQAFLSGYDGDPAGALDLERLYLERTLRMRPHRRDVLGLPQDLAEIGAIREKRRALGRRLGEAAPSNPWGEEALIGWLPFAWPVFIADQAKRDVLVRRARALGFDAGIYSVDAARNQFAPEYREVVLLPCHHRIPSEALDGLLSAIVETA